MADRVIRAIITGSSAGAVAAFEETSLAADAAADESSGKMDEAGSKIGNIFHKIAGSAGSVFAPLGTALDKTGDKFDEADTKGKSFSKGMSSLGGTALLGVAAGAAVVGAAAIKMGSDFQAGTSSLAASAGISDKAAASIGNAFLHTAGTTIYSGAAIQTAYTGVAAQLGSTEGHALSASQAMTVMQASMDLAEGSGNSLGDTTTQLAKTMQVFGTKASGAAAVSNVLFVTGQKTGLGIDGVSAAFVKLHTQLGTATPPMSQMGGLLVDLANHGMAGRGAVSAVSAAMANLLKVSTAVNIATTAQKTAFDDLSPSLKTLATQYANGKVTTAQFTAATAGMAPAQANAIKAYEAATTAIGTSQQKLQNLGITVDNSQHKFVGMASVIAQLHQKISGETQAQQLATVTQAFGATAASKMLAIVQAGPAAYDSATAAVSKAGAAHAAAAKQAQTLGHQFALVKATVMDFVTELGLKLLPVIGSVFDFIAKHKIVLVALGVTFGAVVGTMIGFWVADTIAATSFWTAATGGIIILVAALAVGIAWIVKHWSTVWTDMKAAPLAVWHFIENSVLKPIEGAFSDVVTFIKSHWELLAEILLAPVMPALALFLMFHTQIIGFFEDIVGKVKAVWDTITTGVSTFITGVVGFFDKLPGRIVSGISTIVSDIKAIWDTCTTDVSKFISGIVSFFEGLPSKIMAALGNIGSDVWKAITSHIPGAGAVSSIVSGIKGFLHLAGGGLVTRPTFAMIGESGPEMVLNAEQTKTFTSVGSVRQFSGMGAKGVLGGGQTSSNGGGNIYIENLTLSGVQSPNDLVNALIRYSRANGGIPIKVK